jgi:hypothetical protein
VANYSDNLAGLRIDNIALEHVFLFCVSDVTFTTPNSARCSGSRAIVRGCPSGAHPIRSSHARLSASVHRRGRCDVARLVEEYGDADDRPIADASQLPKDTIPQHP